MAEAIEDAEAASAVATDAARDADPQREADEVEAAGDESHETHATRPLRRLRVTAWECVRTVAAALALSFAIRVVIVEPFHIPSESMEPTLVPGDFIGATKFPYGWSRVSTSPIPLPMIPGRLFGRIPERGELVVFRNRLDGDADYVKRVIGVPGDRVQMRAGVLYLNGEAAPTKLVRSFDGEDPRGEPVRVDVYNETIPGGCSHLIQHLSYPSGREEGQNYTQEFLVPEGHVFVMGDNRDASYDSRLPGRVGMVPAAEIIGRAEFVFLSVGDGFDLRDASSWTNFRLKRTLKTLPCES